MKKAETLYLALFAVLLLLLISVASFSAAGPVVNFPDPNLDRVIRAAIGKGASDTIYASDLAVLTAFSAPGEGIVNLEGIEYCVNLLILSLEDNQISDITPLSELAALVNLRLFENQIQTIDPLSGLMSLKSVYLYANQIRNIAPLSGLAALQTLWLGNNQISDITPLSNLKNLVHLHLDENEISDITPLSGLTALQTLWLDHNQISNIIPLSGLESLLRLYLDYNEISDIDPLSELESLLWLNLDYNEITDIISLSGLTALQYLSLGYNQIREIDPLLTLKSVTSLLLDGNRISDIASLSGMPELHSLGLTFNQISDIGPLLNNPGIGDTDQVAIYNNWLCLADGSQDLSDLLELHGRVADLWMIPQCAPKGLTATAVSPTRIDLQWDGIEILFEEGFKIERKEEGETYTEIVTVAPDTAAYSDTGLTALTRYCYRVRACNAGGESCYTNEACVTSLPPFDVDGSGAIDLLDVVLCAQIARGFVTGTANQRLLADIDHDSDIDMDDVAILSTYILTAGGGAP